MTERNSVPEFDRSDRRALPYRKVPGARLTKGPESEEHQEYFLKVTGGQLLVLGEHERCLWEALDGASNFAEIAGKFRAQFGIALRDAELARFLADMLDAGAVERLAQPLERPPRLVALAAPTPKKVALGAAAADAADAAADAAGAAERGNPAAGGATDRRAEMARVADERRRAAMSVKRPWQWHMGNPERFLAILALWIWPFRHVALLSLPFLIGAALLIGIKHQQDYYNDWAIIVTSLPQWPALWVVEHCTTWPARWYGASVLTCYGGKITEWQLKIFLGIFIRVHLEEDESLKKLPRRERLWTAASPLLYRLMQFGISMPLWLMLRQTHPIASKFMLFMAFMGFASFLMCCIPFIPLYGYKFLSTLLENEHLYSSALRLVTHRLKGRPAPVTMSTAERWGLAWMGGVTIIFSTLYLGHLMYNVNAYVVTSLGGFGVALMFVITGAGAAYFIVMARFLKKLRALKRVSRVGQGPGGPAAADAAPHQLVGP